MSHLARPGCCKSLLYAYRRRPGAARFLFVPLPSEAGPVTLDFNRAQLPPCAFSDAFICPLPPRQNILPFAVEAGEQQARDHA
ncbi:MAG: uncharacterized protein JWP76_4575 [Dactylosporangium sp.]|jgi:uncharacterized protein (DUF1684 family)|nr:uncharacterized protein [Dactylosporangium sp.]